METTYNYIIVANESNQYAYGVPVVNFRLLQPTIFMFHLCNVDCDQQGAVFELS